MFDTTASNTAISTASNTAISTASNTAISAPIASRPYVWRDGYGAIASLPDRVRKLVDAVKTSAGWQEGIESLNRRGGFEARSIDVYGYDEARNLAVVQLRRTYRRKSNYFAYITKVYALIGLDDGQLFSHVLENSPRRLRDLDQRSPESVVQWAEKMIFGLKHESDVSLIKRQRDVALVPVKKLPKDAAPLSDADGVTFRESHKLVGQIYRAKSGYYCVGGRETRLLHTKREHGPVYTKKGEVFRVVVGRRGDDPWWLDATLGD
jgi:hypothetical protein